MPYIGKTPLTGAYQLCDTITTSATATYNLLVGGSAVIPGAAQNCIVSLNGVVQAPVGAYTVSGSTIVFASTLSATDVIDFILILGNVFDIGKPTDGSVTNASIANGTINLTSKVTGVLPVANGGTNLSSGFANGITEADQWRITSNLSSAVNVDITANWERNDSSFDKIGTGMRRRRLGRGLSDGDFGNISRPVNDYNLEYLRSLDDRSGSHYSNLARSTLENAKANEMNEQFEFVKSSSFEFLKHEYESHLFQINELKIYKDELGDFLGKIIGTTHDGKLVMEKSNSIVNYALKEVAFL
jgi:hypothetical protein